MIQLTPIVKNILLLNVVVFIAMQIAVRQSNMAFLYTDYFSLHKPAASLVNPTVEVDGTPYFMKRGSGASSREMQAAVDSDPAFQEMIREEGIPADRFKPLQIITHFFNHSLDWIFHIIFNMFVLASFGPILESIMGPKKFLAFYLFCGVVGGIFIALLDPSIGTVVGASGAIFGVMVAFAMYFPKQKLNIMFIPIGFEARNLVIGLGIMSLVFVVLDFFNIQAGGAISHFGHLAGMVAAVLFFYVEKFLPFSLQD